MEKVVPNSKFVGQSTEIIRQSKIKGPLYILNPDFSELLEKLEQSHQIYLIYDKIIYFIVFRVLLLLNMF